MASTVIQPSIALVAPFADPVYALKSDNGHFRGLFTQTIGTNNAVMFQSNGYSFGWKPDNILYIDDQDNMDVVYGVNPSASAQYWNNKVTYVGTTQLTSDVFECLNNQLKHTVSLVAPPRLPASYMGTPVNVAVGGVITYDSTLSIVADGVTHTTDFVTNGGLSFQDANDKEIYSLPKIFAQDNAGDISDGQYKVTFNSDGTISLYMMVSWSWLQTASYPVAIDPTVVVASAYDTSGNGGRKIVRLSNNWIVCVVFQPNVQHTFYVSKDGGTTFNQLCYSGYANIPSSSFAICSSGTMIYFIKTSNSYAQSNSFDASTITNADISGTQKTLDSGQSSFGSGCSLTIDGTSALHATWCSVNTTYSNSKNIRCSKSTDGGTTWATPAQITTLNTSGWYAQNPCIVVNSSYVPVIAWETQQGANVNSIISATWNGTAWVQSTVYAGGSTQQSSPCSIEDSSNNIHVFWLSSTTTVIHSTSTNNGSTWSSTDTVYTGTSLGALSVGYNSSANKCYVLLSSGSPSTVYYVSGTTNAWNTTTTIGAGTNPQVLWSEFNENSSDAIRYVWNTGSAIDYDSIGLNQPPNAPIPASHNNFDATTAQTFTWTFSSSNLGDSQSAYQLQIVDADSGSVIIDTGKVTSATSSYNLNANTLTNGHNYQWRVLTYDSSNTAGPYCSYSFFLCAAPPNLSIVSPNTDGSTITTSYLTPNWLYSDPAQNNEQSYEILLTDSTDNVLFDTGVIKSADSYLLLNYRLSPSGSYKVKITVTNSKNVSSAQAVRTFVTSFTPPAVPTFTSSQQTGYIGLTITNPTPTGGQPALAYNDIYRRKTNTALWTRIATNIANNGTYSDYAVASGQSYDYKITAVSTNQTDADSAVSSQSITFRGLMIHQVNNPATLLNLLYQTQPKNDEWVPASAQMKFAGRTNDVVQFGQNETYTLSGQQTVLMDSDGQWNALNSMIRAKTTLCVRDGRGRKMFGAVVDLKTTDLEFGRQVDLEFVQVDFTEAV